MTKKNPDKREQKRLKKIEDEKQNRRYRVAREIVNGRSLREAGRAVNQSADFARTWRDRLLEPHRYIGERNGRAVEITEYTFRKDWRERIASRRTGPRPGATPKVDEIYERVIQVRKMEFCGRIGARKIGLIAGVDASPPTVMKALRRGGLGPEPRKCRRHDRRVARPAGNDQWNIDFVLLGYDPLGRQVESLSVTDDHSRFVFSANVTLSATTDFVIGVLEELFGIYGRPRRIRSDHGTQWYAVNGGNCRFDEWCRSMGIRHDMAPIRTPEGNGKVERFHGCIRTEADLPEVLAVDGYREILVRYRHFFNCERPHCSLDYRTPWDVYFKTYSETEREVFRNTVTAVA